MASSISEDAVSGAEGDGSTVRRSTIGEHRTSLYGAIMRKDTKRTAELLATIPASDLERMRCSDHTQGQLSILHAAVETGSVEIVQLLLERGFIPTVKDKAGRSPLDIAKAANLEDMVKVLRSSCEVSDASNTKNSKENMVHKTSADSGVSSSSENTTSSDIRSNGEETATAVPNLSPANMALPVSPAVSMATESAEPDLSVDTSTKDAVFAFLKRRLNNKYWKDFFRALGFPNKDIMELKFHFINISLEECIVQGLQSWDKKNGDMGILFGALCHEDVNQRILVDDLKRRFSKLRPIPIKPIKSQADLQTEARNSAHSMENSNGFNGRHERTPSTRRQGGDHTPSPGFKRKKTGSLFDKLPFRKVSTDDGGQNESKKSKGRRQSIDEGKNLKNRAEEFFGIRRSSHDDKMTGSVSTTNNNGPIDKANLSKISETNIQDSGVESSPLQSPVQYVEADVHTTMITDDSERQSVASTSTRRSSGEMSLVIHESGSEGSSTPRKRSPRSSKKKKEKRSSDSSSIFSKVSIPSPSIFRKSTSSNPPSPSPKGVQQPYKNQEKRRRMGHVTPTPNNPGGEDYDTGAFILLPSTDHRYNGQIPGSETTSDEGSERQSSRKDSSETQASVHTETSLEPRCEAEIDEATQHLLDAGKSIEILLNSFKISDDVEREYKTTAVDTTSQSVIVELIENSGRNRIRPTRPIGRQRSYSDSDIKMERIVTKTNSGTYTMDFYFKQRSNSSATLGADIPKIRQHPMRRHSAQTCTDNDICESIWQPRSGVNLAGRKVISFDSGSQTDRGHRGGVVDLSTTI